jgi:uncharacterized protein YigE (DUF2233 family)
MRSSRKTLSRLQRTASALLAVAIVSTAHADPSALKPKWENLAPGLESAHIYLHNGTVFSSSIVLVRAQPADYTLRAIRAEQFGWKRASVKALCKAAGATACINANFFDEQGRPLGLVVSRGFIHNKLHRGGGTMTGVLYATESATQIVHRDSFSFTGVVEAVQAGPRLIARGLAVEGIKESSPSSNLSVVCIDRGGRTILLRVTSGVFGGSLHGLQKNLLHPEIGCEEALNFDGGGSSQLFVSADTSSLDVDQNLAGEDDVPVALGLFKNGAPNSSSSPTATPR